MFTGFLPFQSNEFLGRVLVRPHVRLLHQTELGSESRVSFKVLPRDDSTSDNITAAATQSTGSADVDDRLHLRWLPMSVGYTRTGDVLAAVELVQIPDDTPMETKAEKRKPSLVKRGADVVFMADDVSPQYSTYRYVIFCGNDFRNGVVKRLSNRGHFGYTSLIPFPFSG